MFYRTLCKMSKNGKAKQVMSEVKQELISANKQNPGRVRKIKIEYEENSAGSELEAPKKKILKKEDVKLEVPEVAKTSKSPRKSFEPKADYVPEHYEELIENMRNMRATHPAPVDNMGCDVCHDSTAPENIQRFQKLVALMLSSQTKDEVTHAACQRLKAFGFTPEKILNADTTDLEDVLKPVGFFRVKAKNLQKTAKILIEEYNSDIPSTLEGLMKLPGVGPKMGHLCMRSAWKAISGIGVDTHVHRISNRLKFVHQETKNPEQTRQSLEAWLPKKYWDEINLLMVGFGQTICVPINPKCQICINNKICPNAFKESGKRKKKAVE